MNNKNNIYNLTQRNEREMEDPNQSGRSCQTQYICMVFLKMNYFYIVYFEKKPYIFGLK